MLDKVSLYPLQDSAVGFFRILQPGRVMAREKLTKSARSLPFSGEQQAHYYEFNDKVWLELAKDADIMWSTIVYKPEYQLRFLNLRKYFTSEFTRKFPRVVFDMDDNFFSIPADNPVYDETEPLRKNFGVCLRMADGVTVSTPALKRLYERYNKNIFINPNGLDFGIWDKLKKTTRKGKKIRIGWRGHYGHKHDLEMIRGAIEAIQKDYKVELVTLGWEGWESKYSHEMHKNVSLFEYPAKLASLNLDIAIIPLVDSAFNRCKSNLAYLEYSALKIPTVLSPVENQRGMVAMEAKSNYEWYSALEKLIKDEVYRKELGEKAYQFVKDNYNVHRQVHKLAKWFEELPQRKDI